MLYEIIKRQLSNKFKKDEPYISIKGRTECAENVTDQILELLAKKLIKEYYNGKIN